MGGAQTKAAARMRLTYFNIKGKGEPIRLAAAYGGLPLEDVRLGREEFYQMRSEGKVPFNQLPVAEFFSEDGQQVCKIAQTRAILRLVGKSCPASSLYSEKPEVAAVIDSFLDFEEDLFAALRCSVFPVRWGWDDYKDEDDKKARRSKIAAEVMTPKLEILEKALQGSSTGWVAGTAGPSIADFALAVSIGWVNGGIVDGVESGYMDKFPGISEYLKRFAEVEEIKAYYEKK